MSRSLINKWDDLRGGRTFRFSSMFGSSRLKGGKQRHDSAQRPPVRAEVVNEAEPQVVYAEAVPVPSATGQLPVHVMSEPAPGEQAQCRSCGRAFVRNPRFNDCDGRYFRCERCNKPPSVEQSILLDCVVS